MGHRIEIDQSNKVVDSGPTVIAFANGIDDAILILSKVKSQAIHWLRRNHTLQTPANVLVFVAAVFLLLEPYLDQLDTVVIDIEYTGYNRRIKDFLLTRIWRNRPGFEAWRIEFGRVGKGPAHHKANLVREGKDRKRRTAKLRDLLNVL